MATLNTGSLNTNFDDLTIPVSLDIAAEMLWHAWLANVPAVLIGEPGIAKTSLSKQLAKRIAAHTGEECEFIDPFLPCRDTTDLAGLQKIVGDTTVYTRPVSLIGAEDAGYRVLCLDELMNAPAMIQTLASPIMLERRAGGHRLGRNTYPMATGNLPKHKGGAQQLLSILKSRAEMIFISNDPATLLDPWLTWAETHDIEPELVAFHRHTRGRLLQAFDPDAPAYPCLRSNEKVSRTLKAYKLVPDPKSESPSYAGIAGRGFALDFSAFLQKWRDLSGRFNLDGIIAHPAEAEIPSDDEPGVQFVVVCGLSRRITDGNIKAVLTYLGRMPNEFEKFAMRDAFVRNPKLQQTSTAIAWLAKNHGMVR